MSLSIVWTKLQDSEGEYVIDRDFCKTWREVRFGVKGLGPVRSLGLGFRVWLRFRVCEKSGFRVCGFRVVWGRRQETNPVYPIDFSV